MSLKRNPKANHGFIYILSNPSMPNVFKVGMTTNSVGQRIRELGTTGVPRQFKAEKIFEIPVSSLRSVERLAHKTLKSKDLHHGKEFFRGPLHVCVAAVQDAIYEVTADDSIDLLGEAKRRAREQEEVEEKRRDIERKKRAELDQQLR